MFKKNLLIICFFIILPFSALAETDYVPGELIIKYKDNRIDLETKTGRLKAASFVSDNDLSKQEDFNKLNVSLVKIEDGSSVEEKARELSLDSNIEFVEPNYLRYPQTISTNDPYRSYLWGLDNTGQTIGGSTGLVDSDMDISEAWQHSTGTEVIVAVIDSGVAYNHPDLLSNMWDGSDCKDEFGNYLGSCLHGYDFVDEDKNPLPSSDDEYYNHGTHIAGTIAAAKNNGVGIIGVAPGVKIMALRFGFAVSSEIRAINFAIANGAKIISTSFSGSSFSTAEYNAILSFKQAGGLYMAAASNNAVNNDQTPYYPASYDLNNIITVAATDNRDNLASFSNYGHASVDVGAPGHYIYSTITSETNLFSDWMSNVEEPNLPAGFEKGGDNNLWKSDIDSNYGKIISSTLGSSYASSSNNFITSPSFDFTSTASAYSSFRVWCNSEYNGSFDDYLVLEYSNDGGITFNEQLKINEEFLAAISDTNVDSPLGATYFFNKLFLPKNYLVNNFKFRWRWITDSDDNSGNGDLRGCWINSFNIRKLSDGGNSTYAYYSGTSMASPHVSGLAALISAVRPDINYSKIKDIILNTGDRVNSLDSRTVTGRRINAGNAVNFALAADLLLPETVTKGGNVLISINNNPISSSTIWIAPSSTSIFIESDFITSANGNSNLIMTPKNAGVYKIFVIDNITGLISPASMSDIIIDNTKPVIPTFSTIANDGLINSLESDSFLVSGTAEPGTNLQLIISDGFSFIEQHQAISSSTASYEFNCNLNLSSSTSFNEGNLLFTIISTNILGNSSMATTTVVYDKTSPVITNISTVDLNKNGKLDTVKITFSKSILDSSLNITDFEVDSYSNQFFNSSQGTLNDNIIYLGFNEKDSLDSDAEPLVSYNGTSTISVDGNYLLPISLVAHDNVSPFSNFLGDGVSNLVINSDGASIIFSENIATSSRLTINSLFNRNVNQELIYSWNDNILNISASSSVIFTSDIVALISDYKGNSSYLKLVDVGLASNQVEPDSSGLVLINNSNDVIISDPYKNITVTVDSGFSSGAINVSSLLDEDNKAILPNLELLSDNLNQLQIEIASSTVIESPASSWTGMINIPIAKNISLPTISGFNRKLAVSFEVGLSSSTLYFSKGVRILIPNQAGKKAAYLKSDGVLVDISTTCQSDNQLIGDSLSFGGDCFINTGVNLVIWTKHFTNFVVYSQAAIESSNGGGGGAGGGGGSGAISINYCSEVEYSPWQNCSGNQQFRTVISSYPPSCTLTAKQQIDLYQACSLELAKEVSTSTNIIVNNILETNQKPSTSNFLSVVNEERKMTSKTDLKLIAKLIGKILLQVENRGQAWYLNPKTLSRYYLADGPSAYEALRRFGLGINNDNLSKIPVSPDSVLPDNYQKSKNVSKELVNKLKGKILIQVEGRGEAWYVNPSNGYRYYLANGEEAYKIMRKLSLGITNLNLRKIPVYLEN